MAWFVARYPDLVCTAHPDHMPEVGLLVGELALTACLAGETPHGCVQSDYQQVRHRVPERIGDRRTRARERTMRFPEACGTLLCNSETVGNRPARQAGRFDERPPGR